MAGLTIKVEGIEAIRARYSQAPKIIDQLLKQAARDLIALGVTKLAAYPALRTGQKYRRSGRYGRGWTDSPTRYGVGAGGITVFKRNTTSYGPFIADPQRQSWFHRGRWATVDDAQTLMEQAAPARLDHAAQQAAKSLGG